MSRRPAAHRAWPRPRWRLLIGVAVSAAVVLAIRADSPLWYRDHVVPAVVGMSGAEATKAIVGRDLRFTMPEWTPGPSESADGISQCDTARVTGQRPAAGTKLSDGGVVHIEVRCPAIAAGPTRSTHAAG